MKSSSMKKEKLERIFEAIPAFDKRNKDPKKNYGIHGVELRFVVKGKKGAVQFVVFTGMHLPNVQEEQDSPDGHTGYDGKIWCPRKPMAADIGFHSPKPLYEGQEPMGMYRIKIDTKAQAKYDTLPENATIEEQLEALSKVSKKIKNPKLPICPYLGKPCYYDGSSLHAEKVFDEVFLPGGTEKLWPYLEDYYYETFYPVISKKKKVK